MSNSPTDSPDTSSERSRDLREAPLGPTSLLWKYGADSRLQLLRGYTGIMQNMKPEFSQALLDHSKFFAEPFARLERSTPQIIDLIYVDESDPLGTRIRDYHTTIHGRMPDGSRYHSMNPDTYWWAHATFVERVIRAQEMFGEPFTEEEKDQLCREGVTWWRKYGMSMRPVLDNYADYQAYFDKVTDEELTRTETVDFALRQVKTQKIDPPPGVSPAVWNIVWKPVMHLLIWSTVGSLDPRQREILGEKWTSRDEKLFELLKATVRWVHPRLPQRRRYLEPGYSRMKQAGMLTEEPASTSSSKTTLIGVAALASIAVGLRAYRARRTGA